MQKGYDISVASDRMSVTLCVQPGANPSAAEIVTALRELKIAALDEKAVVELLQNRDRNNAVTAVVAAGVQPVDERASRFDFRVPVADGDSCTIARVEAEQVVAFIGAGTPGTDGRDIFGATVPFKKISTELGRNLASAKGQVVTTARGNLRLHNNLLRVEPLLDISDDGPNLAPIRFDGDAMVKGCLSEGRQLDLTGTLTVGAAIEAVRLTTGGSVYVKGGIIGKQRGHCVIGGDLRCRYISGGTLEVAGNIDVQSELVHSRLVCHGKLSVPRGPIYGGDVTAIGGIVCQVLGQSNGTPTSVEVGSARIAREMLERMQASIEANQKRVNDIRSKIEPLMRMLRQLTPQQRERVTELMSEAGDLESTTEELSASLDQRANDLRARSLDQIFVSGAAFPGVTVRIGAVETVIPTALKGPFQLTTRKFNGVTEMVLLEEGARSATVLPSRPTGISQAA